MPLHAPRADRRNDSLSAVRLRPSRPDRAALSGVRLSLRLGGAARSNPPAPFVPLRAPSRAKRPLAHSDIPRIPAAAAVLGGAFSNAGAESPPHDRVLDHRDASVPSPVPNPVGLRHVTRG